MQSEVLLRQERLPETDRKVAELAILLALLPGSVILWALLVGLAVLLEYAEIRRLERARSLETEVAGFRHQVELEQKVPRQLEQEVQVVLESILCKRFCHLLTVSVHYSYLYLILSL